MKSTLQLILVLALGAVLMRPAAPTRMHPHARSQRPYAAAHAQIDRFCDALPKASIHRHIDKPFFKALRAFPDRSHLSGPFYYADQATLAKPILGNFSLRELLYSEAKAQLKLGGKDGLVFFRLHRGLLHAMLDLYAALRHRGLHPALSINSSYRSPWHNEHIRGARHSRHMHGEAVDLLIGDVDGDGKADARDKQLVLEIVDKDVLRGRGGMGRYPGTMVVHMDVRPWTARWDTYKR